MGFVYVVSLHKILAVQFHYIMLDEVGCYGKVGKKFTKYSHKYTIASLLDSVVPPKSLHMQMLSQWSKYSS